MTGDARLVFGTGLLGGYTTFSTWIFEAQRLGEDGEWIALRRSVRVVTIQDARSSTAATAARG